MSSELKNLSFYNESEIPDASNLVFGIVVSEWNISITNNLADAAIDTLLKHGAKKENIIISYVPGSFELPRGAQYLIENSLCNVIICLGCVIQGETRHFEFICQAVSQGIMKLNIETPIPVIFGVLTTNNKQQAEDRSGGKHGNKGVEAAVAAIKMALPTKQTLKAE